MTLCGPVRYAVTRVTVSFSLNSQLTPLTITCIQYCIHDSDDYNDDEEGQKNRPNEMSIAVISILACCDLLYVLNLSHSLQ